MLRETSWLKSSISGRGSQPRCKPRSLLTCVTRIPKLKHDIDFIEFSPVMGKALQLLQRPPIAFVCHHRPRLAELRPYEKAQLASLI